MRQRILWVHRTAVFLILAVRLNTSAEPVSSQAVTAGFHPLALPAKHCNGSLTELVDRTTMHGTPDSGAAAAAVSVAEGRQMLGGVPWLIASPREQEAIVVGPTGSSRKPDSVAGIAVGRKAVSLHFLHAFAAGPAIDSYRFAEALQKRKNELPPEKPVVFRYRVRYRDGKVVQVPVRWREGVDSWLRYGAVPPVAWAEPVVLDSTAGPTGPRRVLYAMRWPNPRPEVPISSIDMINAGSGYRDYGVAALVALTVNTRKRSGGDFYVAPPPAGNDSNPGTFERPWATPHRAAQTLRAGDRVFFRQGRYPITTPVVPAGSGSQQGWIEYCAYPGESAVIDAYDASMHPIRPDSSQPPWDDLGIMYLREKEYLRVHGLTLINSRGRGMSLHRSRHIEVLFCDFFRTHASGIHSRRGGKNIRVIGCTVVQSNSSIMSYGNDYRVVPKLHTSHESITMSDIRHFEVAFCEVYGSDKEGIDCKGTAIDGTVHHNYVHSTASGGIYIDSWGLRIDSIEVFANVVHDAAGISVGTENHKPVYNIDIHHNLVFDCYAQGISAWGAETEVIGMTFRNNTVVRNGAPSRIQKNYDTGGLLIRGTRCDAMRDVTAEYNIFADNIIYPMATDMTNPQMEQNNIVLRNNLCYPFDPDQKVYKPDMHHMTVGDNAIQEPAGFVAPGRDDFRLKKGSAAATAGPGGSALGAIPAGMPVHTNQAFGGQTLSRYSGGVSYVPVMIPLRFYTAVRSHNDSHAWFSPRFWNYDFKALPSGLQALRGVTWHIADRKQTGGKSVLMLGGPHSKSRPDTIGPIPVMLKADALHFLHTASPGDSIRRWQEEGDAARRQGPVMFCYRINYQDRPPIRVPVRWHTHVEGWLRFGVPRDPEQGRIAWSTPVSLQSRKQGWLWWWRQDKESEGFLCAYRMRWQNPHKSSLITAVDIIANNAPQTDLGSAAVFAISAEPGNGES